MSIDWFTFIAQIFNLLILLFLLRKFLYLPVLKAVEIRQKLIADELKNAEQSRLKAQKAEEKCLQKAQEIEREKQQILADVQREAEKLAADLREQAENQYHQSQAEWRERLKGEQKSFDAAIQKLTVEHFNRFAEKAMKQMANADLNDWIIKQFADKIKNLPADEKIKLRENFCSQKTLRIETADEMSAERKKQTEDLLRAECGLSDGIKFQYRVDENLLGGIIVQGGEYMVEWSLKSYLQEFKQAMSDEVSRLINRGAA